MKRLALMAVCLLLAGGASAQPPQEVDPAVQISLGVGQTRVFRFDEPVARVDVMTKGTAEAAPQSDRQISLSGLEPGITQMFVFSPNGTQIYSASIIVSPEPGHQVKIYGTNKNDDLNAGYTAVYCDEFSCGRPDKDLPKATAVTVDRLSRMGTRSPNNRSGF